MIEFVEVTSANELADLRRAYLASLNAPLDGMWETFTGMGRHTELRSSGERAGYFSLNDEGRILELHIAEPFMNLAAQLFGAVVARDDVHGAVVSTADPGFLGLCLDVQKSMRVHTLLYNDHRPCVVPLKGDQSASLDVVEPAELETIAQLQRDSIDQELGDWLVGYLENLINRRELHALRRDGEILGTGETRISESQPPYVDLGVITMRPHRKQGVAAHILGRLKKHCYERQLVPICSTTVENAAARRAITRAGFVSTHRLLEVGF